MVKRYLSDQTKADIVKETLNGHPDGIIISFNPELAEVDLEDLNNYLLPHGMEASYNQVLKKRKLTKDRQNVLVYRKEDDNQSNNPIPRKAKRAKG